MRYWLHVVVLLSCLFCLADEKSPEVSKQDLKLAKKSFQHALELQKAGSIEAALHEATAAASLVPGNMEYTTAREFLKQETAGGYLRQGNTLAEIGDNKGAAAEFRIALSIDPENSYMQQRLRDVAPPRSPEGEHVLRLLASADEIELTPQPGQASFHMRAGTQELYRQIGKAFGIAVSFDQTLTSRNVRFDVDNVDFFTAMDLAGKVTRTFWAPVLGTLAIVATDTQELRRQYERFSEQTFYVNNVSAPVDLNDIANIIRSVFDIRFVSIEPDKNIITVRARKEQLRIVSDLLDDLMAARPEIILDVKAYEVSTDKLRQYGLNLTTSFQVFNIASEITTLLGPAAGPVIQQLIKTGTINPAQIPLSALGQVQGSPLLQPFIFFGKGLFGLTGITALPISGHLSYSDSAVKSLEDVTLRAADGVPASMNIGTRVPITTASFTSISVAGNGQPVVGTPFPSVQYEDIGVILKTTPHCHSDGSVTLDLELAIKSLGAVQANGLPIITNREFKGGITLDDGAPTLVTGLVTEQETRSTQGYPALGQVPLVNSVLNSNSKERLKDEILIVITPHIVRKPFRTPGADIHWLAAGE